jgi:hypothetical protein
MRLILTLLVVFGLGLPIVLLRRGRARRARLAFEQDTARLHAQRRISDDAGSFVTLHSLAEAQTMDHTAIVMQGGDGAQIYLTAPTKYVACDEEALRSLLNALDAVELNDPTQATLTFELAPIGSGVYGGMGGGSVIDGVWLHPRLMEAGLLPVATDVLYGRRTVDDARAAFPQSLRD